MRIVTYVKVVAKTFLLFRVQLGSFAKGVFRELLSTPGKVHRRVLRRAGHEGGSCFHERVRRMRRVLGAASERRLFPLLYATSLLLFTTKTTVTIVVKGIFLIPILTYKFLFLPF